ncbi:ATP-binding protein [uncultured Actinomyces sp.]|uniref:ATP-binding protein n=1 Tax=uncultured Actinomyces sp. TaxID=249061 RepID=UPI0028E7C5EA|nr:ATP-binding protein [uncultured Actinomyces sp.]
MSQEHKFLISMTILDHLGRQLYRNFITVIGEAISNAWDADARNVWIELDHSTQTLSILDDGHGMSSKDLDDKFLKIGYTKRGRKGTERRSASGRPYIGAKGIGKLALLSCADTISIASKTTTTEPTGCLISNIELDQAITNDLTTEEVTLGDAIPQAYELLGKLTSNSGTALILNGMRTANSSDEFLRSSIAQGFRFSLIDPEFHIYYNNAEITVQDLGKLISKTQFAWLFPGTKDDFTDQLDHAIERCRNTVPEKEYTIPPTTLKTNNAEVDNDLPVEDIKITGFIASTNKPRDLQIYGSDERATLDLFVNGRIRERNILQHIPSSRVPEQYIYGQIHINGLDRAGTDPFTSAREQVIANDPIYRAALAKLRLILKSIYDHWDIMRIQLKEEGDPTTKNASKETRAADRLAQETMNKVRDQFPVDERERWAATLNDIVNRASLNSKFYTRAFIAENLLRSILVDAGYQKQEDYPEHIQRILYANPNPQSTSSSTPPQSTAIQTPHSHPRWKNTVEANRTKDANQGYQGRTAVRHTFSDLDHLMLSDLLRFSDKSSSNGLSLKVLAPNSTSEIDKLILVRNIVMHCCTLTQHGRSEFTRLYEQLSKEMIDFATDQSRP